MYVGPFLAVETGNVWGGNFDVWGSAYDPHYDRLFVAQFRNFSDVSVNPTPVPISIMHIGSNFVISWAAAGTLLESPVLGAGASWTAVPGAPNTPAGGSYTNTPTGSEMFFRLKQQ